MPEGNTTSVQKGKDAFFFLFKLYIYILIYIQANSSFLVYSSVRFCQVQSRLTTTAVTTQILKRSLPHAASPTPHLPPHQPLATADPFPVPLILPSPESLIDGIFQDM